MDQKKVYNKFRGHTGSSNGDILHNKESRTFWSGICEEEEQSKWRLNGCVIWVI